MYKCIILLFSLFYMGNQSLTAQGIYVESYNGDLTSMNMDAVNRVTFPENNLVFSFTDQTTKTFSLLAVKKIYFADNTGTDEEMISGTRLVVFPNPVSDILQINNLSETPIEVVIYSIHGRLILTDMVTKSDNQIDVSRLENGMYLLKMNNQTTKLIKK